jgi:hypothetical protein
MIIIIELPFKSIDTERMNQLANLRRPPKDEAQAAPAGDNFHR